MTVKDEFKKHAAKLGLTVYGDDGDTATITCSTCGASWPMRSDGVRPGITRDGRTIDGFLLCPKRCNEKLWEGDTFVARWSQTIKERLEPTLVHKYVQWAAAKHLCCDPGPCEAHFFDKRDTLGLVIGLLVWWDNDGVIQFLLGTRDEVMMEMNERMREEGTSISEVIEPDGTSRQAQNVTDQELEELGLRGLNGREMLSDADRNERQEARDEYLNEPDPPDDVRG